MTATAIWTVHCALCFRWDEHLCGDTKAECERLNKRAGWLIRTGPQGGNNYCPNCRGKAEA